MKNIRSFFSIGKYEVNTIEYENNLIIMISSILCFCCAVLNYLFFSFYYSVEIIEIFKNSLILIMFGISYIISGRLPLSSGKKTLSINGITSLLIIYIVLQYFPLIGPTVWTYSFIIIIVSLLRGNITTLIMTSVTILFMIVLIWNYNVVYSLDENYYVSQLIAFAVLLMTSITVLINNAKKNDKIGSQLEHLKSITGDLEYINASLEEEIQEHQNTIALLDESEKRFKSIVNALPDAVFRIDVNGVFIDCEAVDTSWLLLPKSEFIGRMMSDILPQDISEFALKKIEMTLNTNKMHIMEYKLNDGMKDNFYEMRFVKASHNESYAILRDITESKQKQHVIEYLSYHDQLTGLYNRRFFEEELFRLDKERNYPLTVAMIDVNGLKLTNDAFGHVLGDELLKRVANIIKRECRSDDIVARVGGDEFEILLPRTTADQAEAIARRIYDAVAVEKMSNIVVSVSIGWDTKFSDDQTTGDVRIKAEELMYRKKLTESQSMRNQTIKVILETLNEKNAREKIHAEKVSQIGKRIGIGLNLDYETLKEIESAGLMHDIGKISIRDSLLDKEGKLTELEYEEIKRHPESGYHILKSVDAYSSLAEYILSHHERWDGKGYPKGLKKEEIPLISRILAVADSYEAMISDRPYRKGMHHKEALIELKRSSGTQFDERIVKVFEEFVFNDIN